MNITSELYRRIIQYLNDEISLSQFEDWFLPSLGQILSLPDGPALDLADNIQLALAEMSSGDRTEAELKSIVISLMESSYIDIRESTPYPLLTGTTNPSSIFMDCNIPSASSGFYELVFA